MSDRGVVEPLYRRDLELSYALPPCPRLLERIVARTRITVLKTHLLPDSERPVLVAVVVSVVDVIHRRRALWPRSFVAVGTKRLIS